jgi:imidazolonepropionase-like amidohydrolase
MSVRLLGHRSPRGRPQAGSYKRLTSTLLASLLAAAGLRAEVKVLQGFTLIDGTGRAPAANSAMVVTDGRITWVGPTAQLKAPAGAEIVELRGKFVMPGLINLHGHIGNTVALAQDAKFYNRKSIEENLRTYAQYGVTTVQSLGTDQDLIFQVRDEQRAGRPAVARVYTSGRGFVFKDGYGGLAGVNATYAQPGEIGPVVAKLAAQKVDVVKFWLDDDVGLFPAKMPAPMTQAIIDAARGHGLRTVSHIFYLEDAKRVVRQGIAGLAHSVRDQPVDQELIELMKSKGVWQMAATLYREATMFAYGTTPAYLNDPFFTRSVSDTTRQLLASPERQKTISSAPHFKHYPAFLETAQRNLKKLSDAGVKVGFGTDTGPPGRFPGFGEHVELELMVEAGLTPMQVIRAATRNGAEFLGARDLGTLEVSKWADLVVLNANPLVNIRNSRSIHAVYIAGNEVK